MLSRTESPCGLLDYLAQRSPEFLGERFARFGASTADIARCLESSPGTKVVLHQLADTSLLFIDELLWQTIRALPPDRVIYLGAGAREAFDALEGTL